MQTTDPDGRLYVVVGVLQNGNGELLMQQRLSGKPCEGQWEFPGGKLERHETPQEGLARELKEELGIDIRAAVPLTRVGFDYDHANVWLDVYRVTRFEGVASGGEGQNIRWLEVGEIRKLDLLKAVPPILDVIESKTV